MTLGNMPFLTSGDEDMKTMKPPRSSSSWLSYLSRIPSNSVGILALTEFCWRRDGVYLGLESWGRLINIWLLPRHHDWSIPESCSSKRSHFVSFVVVVAMLQFPMRAPKWWWSCKAPPFQQTSQQSCNLYLKTHRTSTQQHTGGERKKTGTIFKNTQELY